MSRHSKNNCSAPVFTYYERQKLMGKEYGTKKQRLGKDSLKPFDACSICLHTAINPLADPKGHIFCKECIYESLLTQKKEIKKKLKQWEEQQKLLQAQQAEKEREKQEEELLKFAKAETSVIGAEAIKETDKKDPSRSNKLTAFWLPALTPSVEQSIGEKPSKDTKCIYGHKLRLKQLITVNFTPITGVNLDDPTVTEKFMCPTCLKALNRCAGAYLMKPCGHVICKTCCTQFVKNTKDNRPQQCCQCHITLPNDSDVIEMQAGASAFAGHDSGEKKVAVQTTPSPWL